MLACIRHCTGKGWLRKRLVLSSVIGGNLTFIHGTFFEVLVCVSVSMLMLTYSDYLNSADRVSVYFSFFFGAVLASYCLLLLYFMCAKSRLWVTKAKGNRAHKQEENVRLIHLDLLKSETLLKPECEKEVDEILKQRRRHVRKLISEAFKIKEAQFEKFMPLVEDLRLESLVSMSNNMFITVRRLMMLYLAMFILK